MKYEIVGPQFERTDGKTIDKFPQSAEEIDRLKTASKEELKALGLQLWDEESRLYLFPSDWYNYIPEGYMITDISGKVEAFQKGVTDDDIRFGALAYGIVVESK